MGTAWVSRSSARSSWSTLFRRRQRPAEEGERVLAHDAVDLSRVEVSAQHAPQAVELGRVIHRPISVVDAAVEIGADAHVLGSSRRASVMHRMTDDVGQARLSFGAKMARIKADADDAPAARDLRGGRVGDLSVARNQGARVAVRGDDRTAPELKRVGYRLFGHMAEVEDHSLPAHRLQELDAKRGEPAWRAGAAAVAGAAPCRADDAQAEVRPRAELGRRLDRISALHQQHRGHLPALPAADVSVELLRVSDQLQLASAVVVEL